MITIPQQAAAYTKQSCSYLRPPATMLQLPIHLNDTKQKAPAARTPALNTIKEKKADKNVF